MPHCFAALKACLSRLWERVSQLLPSFLPSSERSSDSADRETMRIERPPVISEEARLGRVTERCSRTPRCISCGFGDQQRIPSPPLLAIPLESLIPMCNVSVRESTQIYSREDGPHRMLGRGIDYDPKIGDSRVCFEPPGLAVVRESTNKCCAHTYRMLMRFEAADETRRNATNALHLNV